MKKKLAILRVSAILIPVSERKNNMKNEMNKPYYYVSVIADGPMDSLYRTFDVSHEGLENAIKVAHKNAWSNPETCVMIHRENDTAETVWSLKVSNNEFPGRC